MEIKKGPISYGALNNQYIEDNSEVAKQIKPQLVKERGGAELDVNDFLQIMAAELSNQSMMGGDSGGSKTDYISQLAQFTILEQMNTMTDSIGELAHIGQQNQAFSLVGSDVTYLDEKGEKQEGVVEKVKFTAEGTLLIIDEKEYPIGLVLEYAGNKTGEKSFENKLFEELEKIEGKLEGLTGLPNIGNPDIDGEEDGESDSASIDPLYQQNLISRQFLRGSGIDG